MGVRACGLTRVRFGGPVENESTQSLTVQSFNVLLSTLPPTKEAEQDLHLSGPTCASRQCFHREGRATVRVVCGDPLRHTVYMKLQ